MSETISVFLAGPGHDVVFTQMQPPLLAQRSEITILGVATNWETLEDSLPKTKPEVLVVLASIAPNADYLIKLLALMQSWNGTSIILLPAELAQFQGAFTNLGAVVSGAYVFPVNFSEIPDRVRSAGQTARARNAKISGIGMGTPASGAGGFGAFALQSQGVSPVLTGTKRIAVLTHAGGAGASTIAENLAYELATRLAVKTLLISLGLPPAAGAHFRLRYVPNLTEFFERPGKAAITSATQRIEGLDILLSPESSMDYLRSAQVTDAREPNSVFSALQGAEDGSYAAMIMDLPSDEGTWTLHPLLFANAALLVTRPTMGDLFATRHTLNFMSSLGNRMPREAMFLVINQVSEASALTPRQFMEELANDLGWSPPIVAVIEHDPNVQMAQDQRQPAVLRSEKLAKGLRQIVATLFPGMERTVAQTAQENNRSFLRLPKFKLG